MHYTTCKHTHHAKEMHPATAFNWVAVSFLDKQKCLIVKPTFCEDST